MFPVPSTDAEDIPTGLVAQFVRQSPRFVGGMLLLAAYQYGQYWIDTRLTLAVNAALGGQSETATHLGLGLIGVALGAFVIRVLSRMAIFDGGRIAEYELRKALLHRLHQLGPAFYGRISTGDIMSRFTSDLAQVRTLLGFGVLTLLSTTFALFSALAVMFPISVKLTLASLGVLPILLLVMRQFSAQLFTRQRDNQDSLGHLSTRVQSSIAGVRVIRAFALEDHEAMDFEKSNQDYLIKSLAIARLRGAMWPIMQALTSVGLVIVFWYGGQLLMDDVVDAGEFLAFSRALGRLTWPLIALGFVMSVVQRGRASYSRLSEIFSAQPDIVDGAEATFTPSVARLEVRGLSFSYGDQKVLNDVNFTLTPGESLAVVGRTGSGKSTLAVLVARLLPTPPGTVFLDGVDVCKMSVRAVRDVVGYAQQDPFLFSTTVGRNIAYALEDPDSPQALEITRNAAKEAQILEEVSELPDGFDTVVGERGVQLSGGQKQRIALARALVSEPKILILDDPLSAVDARTETAILAAIDRLRARRSVILVTHRVSAAARCDRVLVLEGGTVVERGCHADLIRQGGLYATFAEEQRLEGQQKALEAENFGVESASA